MKLFTSTKFWMCVTKRILLAFINNSDHQSSCPRMLLCNVLRCSVFMPPHRMAVTGTDCTQMPGIGRTFSGYSSMITSSIRVACWNSQFRGTHKLLRVHHVFEETSRSAVCADFISKKDQISFLNKEIWSLFEIKSHSHVILFTDFSVYLSLIISYIEIIKDK